MDCCGLCADEDREVWLADQISPKIGLSDDDLLDYQTDDGLPMPPAAQRHRPTPPSAPRRSSSSLRKPSSHQYHQDYQHQSPLRPAPSPPPPPAPFVSTNRYPSEYTRAGSRRALPPQQDGSGDDDDSPVIERKPSSRRPAQESPGSTGVVRQPTITRAKSSLPGRHSPPPQQEHTASDREEDTAKGKSSERSTGGGGGGGGGGPAVNGKVPTKLSELTPEEKEEEKKRLQALVKEFAKEAVSGFPVTLVDESTAKETSATFLMDRFLTTITLERESGGSDSSLPLESITGIFKGGEAAAHAPGAAAAQLDHTRLLVLCVSEEPKTVVVVASSRHQRDKVYTCLKILREAEGILIRQQRQHSLMLHNKSAEVRSLEDQLEENEARLARQDFELDAQRKLLLEKEKEIQQLQHRLEGQAKPQAAGEGGQAEGEGGNEQQGKKAVFRPKVGPGGKLGPPVRKPGQATDAQKAQENLQRKLNIAEAENLRLRRETEIMRKIIEEYERSDDDEADEEESESVLLRSRANGGERRPNPVVTAARRGSELATKLVAPLRKHKGN